MRTSLADNSTGRYWNRLPRSRESRLAKDAAPKEYVFPLAHEATGFAVRSWEPPLGKRRAPRIRTHQGIQPAVDWDYFPQTYVVDLGPHLEESGYYPRNRSAVNRNRLEVEACGAHLTLVDGLISDCGRMVAERKDPEGWFDVSTLKEPFRVEGKKTMGYERKARCRPCRHRRVIWRCNVCPRPMALQ